MNKSLEKIRSRGHWRVVVRPTNYNPALITNLADLGPLLQKSVVRLRGWSFPQLGINSPVIYGNYLEGGTDYQHYVEFWRFYQSGQFIHYSGIEEDWRDQSYDLWRPPEDWQSGVSLDLVEVIWTFTEIFEFALRLASTLEGHEYMHIKITASNIEGRTLWDNPGRLHPLGTQTARINKFDREYDLSHAQLSTATRELALKPAKDLFQLFGWSPNVSLIKDLQHEMLRRGAAVAGP